MADIIEVTSENTYLEVGEEKTLVLVEQASVEVVEVAQQGPPGPSGGGTGSGVSSVNGMTDDVVLTAEDVGALPDTTYIPDISGLTSKTYVDAALALRLLRDDVIDNLTTNSASQALSARQGVVLLGLINNINTLLASDTGTLDTIQEIVDFIQVNREDLDSLSIPSIAGLQAALDSKVNAVPGMGLSSNDYTDEQKNKLLGIDAGATQNSSDAHLLNRTNHTGSQAISTVTGLQSALDAKLDADELPATIVEQIIAGPNVSVDNTDPTRPVITAAGGGNGGGVTDHGMLTGLADDDHPQYHTDARGDVRYYTKTQMNEQLAQKQIVGDYATSGELDAHDAANRDRTNHTGTQDIDTVDGLQAALDAKQPAGSYETTTQLDARDAANRSRANHTGTQAIATVDGLQTALDGKAATVHTHGPADLTGTGRSASTYYRGDGVWATPTNTTYSEITSAEIAAGTSTTSRAISGRRAQEIVDKARSGLATSASVSSALATKADLVDGLIPTSQIPALALHTSVVVANQAAMLALTSSQVQPGDIAIRQDGAGTWILQAADPSVLSNWAQLAAPTDAVTSVNGKTSAVTLGKADIGLGNVDNTSDAAKPISTATQTALDAKAPSSHTHTASQISDSTATGRSLLTAASAAAARAAIGAGTSDLQIGTTSTTAKRGDYVPTKAELNLGNVDNTSDADKPVSTAQQTALDAKANASRQVIAGIGLVGGGSLAADRTLALSDTGVAAGTYSNVTLTVDAQGRITAVANGSASVSASRIVVQVRNSTGATLQKGRPVYLNGSSGGIATAAYAQANSTSTQFSAGLVEADIPNGSVGLIVVQGILTGISTMGLTSGAPVFVSADNAGTLTSTAPTAPNWRFRAGFVYDGGLVNGSLYVTPSTGFLGNGTANQVLGMNAAGTAQEMKTLTVSADLTITHSVGGIALALASGVYKAGGTDVAVADGGTGASTAAQARTNLGLGNVSNTSDADKPVSTAQQTALNAKVNGTTRITVGTTAPSSPAAGDLWVDTN